MSGLTPLTECDPELYDIIEHEKARQYRGLEMIASENFTSRAVLDCLGSALTNKYAEGEVGAKYYGGTEFVDQVETLTKQRALAAFKLDSKVWGVNVQPYSGSPANMGVYVGLLRPHDRIMGLDLPSGGHLTHGFYTAKKRISATSIFFESLPYHVDDNGVINYEEMERVGSSYRPSIIIVGASAYVFDYDYPRIRACCDKLGTILMMDMAHTAGLIAAGVLKSPFDYADVVTTTTHKTLRGPRSGLIFYRLVDKNGKPTDYAQRINQAVFPGLQGGPHMNQIAAVCTQMREVASPSWNVYAKQVVSNAKALASELMKEGYKLIGNGTENHIIVWNVKAAGSTGARMEKILERISISVNKNTIPGDVSALQPGGVRMGTSALTTRGMKEEDMCHISNILHRALQISLECAGGTLAEYCQAIQSNEKVASLKVECEALAVKYPMPGFNCEDLKYKNGY